MARLHRIGRRTLFPRDRRRQSGTPSGPRVVIVGSGFAGYECARRLRHPPITPPPSKGPCLGPDVRGYRAAVVNGSRVRA
jgi:hypothetical protein